jgi:hypothetical protein
MEEELKKLLKQELGFNQTQKKYDELDTMIGKIDELRASLEKIRLEPHEAFVKITRDFWEKEYGPGCVRDGISDRYHFIFFGKNEWNDDDKKCLIHLEWKVSDEDLIKHGKYKLWLHFEGSNSDGIKTILENDGTFKGMVKSLEMEFEHNSINASREITFPNPFALMNESDQKSFLNGLYETYAPLLDYVYEQCEKEYKND